jgi:hypothetical protein
VLPEVADSSQAYPNVARFLFSRKLLYFGLKLLFSREWRLLRWFGQCESSEPAPVGRALPHPTL